MYDGAVLPKRPGTKQTGTPSELENELDVPNLIQK